MLGCRFDSPALVWWVRDSVLPQLLLVCETWPWNSMCHRAAEGKQTNKQTNFLFPSIPYTRFPGKKEGKGYRTWDP